MGKAQTQEAKKPEEEKPQVRIQKAQEYLKRTYTREEKEEFSAELSRTIHEISQARLHKKEVVKKLDADIGRLESKISELATKVKDGYEMANIECELTFNYDTCTKKLVRLDTGEVLWERAMSGAELQQPLPFEEKKEDEAPEETGEDDGNEGDFD